VHQNQQAVKPHQAAGLTTVLIPVDNPNPKLATIWKQIDDPSAVVTIIQERNKQHFAQDANTPFTTGEFGTIPYSGTGPLADAILVGSYQSADPLVQMMLDELVRPAFKSSYGNLFRPHLGQPH
jgi:hypothetical protein